MTRAIPAAVYAVLIASCCAVGCDRVVPLGRMGDTDTDTDSDTDTDTDIDTDTDMDTDTDTDMDTDTDFPCVWNVHTSASLSSVWGASANDVFMVGGETLVVTTVIHYHNGSWVELDPGIEAVGLRGIWGTGATDVFVVGELDVVLRYDGSNWDQTFISIVDLLKGVWGASSDDVFAVGGLLSPMVAHYDGSGWTEMTGIPGTTTLLADVWGTSIGNVYVVGSGAILHYNGSSWSSEATTLVMFSSLEAIWGSSSTDVYAVGGALMGSDASMFHKDAGGWSEVDLGPDGANVVLTGIGGRSSSDIFAVGGEGTGGVFLHYDGSSWSKVTGPFDFPLNDVWVAQTGEVFAVGPEGVVYCE